MSNVYTFEEVKNADDTYTVYVYHDGSIYGAVTLQTSEEASDFIRESTLGLAELADKEDEKKSLLERTLDISKQ